MCYQNLLHFTIFAISFSSYFFLYDNNSDLERLSTYNHMDSYRQEATHPGLFCSGFECNKSGLSEVRIVQLVAKENQIRNEYASSKSISNMYAVEWNRRLAHFARSKTMLCLPPSSRDAVIYETRILQKWFPFANSSIFKTPKCLEVMIAQKSIKYDPDEVQTVFNKAEDELIDFFDHTHFVNPTALNRRGATTQMGCDYLTRKNDTHIIMHILCVFGLLYFTNGISNDYTPVVGPACSECIFYINRAYYRFGKTSNTWACKHNFPFLCDDLANENVPISIFKYVCTNTSTTPLSTTDPFVWETKVFDEKSLIVPTKAPHEWPCYQYTVPVIMFTLFIIVVLAYQIYLIVHTHKNGIRSK